MPAIVTSKTRFYRDVKPPVGSQINWSHPLSQGLVGCWLVNEGGGNLVNDLVAKRNGSVNGVLSWLPTPKGIGLSSTGSSSNYIQVPFNSVFQAIPCTVVFSFNMGDLTNYPALIGRCDAVGSFHGINIHIEGSTLALDLKPGAGNASSVRTTKTLLTNTWYQGVAVCNQGGISKDSALYLDSKNISTSITNTWAWDFANNPTIQFFKIQDTFWNPRAMKFGYVYWYNRALSPSEIQSLYVAPYQMIAPQRRFSLISIGEGIPTSSGITYSSSRLYQYWY